MMETTSAYPYPSGQWIMLTEDRIFSSSLTQNLQLGAVTNEQLSIYCMRNSPSIKAHQSTI